MGLGKQYNGTSGADSVHIKLSWLYMYLFKTFRGVKKKKKKRKKEKENCHKEFGCDKKDP